MAKITSVRLRQIIKEELMNVLAEKEDKVDATAAGGIKTAEDVKGSAASKIASDKLASNPTLQKLIDPISDKKGATAFLASVIQMLTAKGVDKNELLGALNIIKADAAAAKT